MKKLIFLLSLLGLSAFGATSFTEFYVQTTGSNLNSGSTTNDAALFTAASCFWTNSTCTIAKAALNPDANVVPNVSFAAVYPDSVTTNALYVALVTATNATTITLSTTVKAGTAMADDTTGATTIKVGGAWAGPMLGATFPFGFVTATLTNLPSTFPRVNIKGGVTYAITNGMTANVAGPIRWQGYTNSVGDLGKAVFDGTNAGASITMLTASGANNDYLDIILSNTGATSGNGDGIAAAGTECTFTRVVCHDLRRTGFALTGDKQVAEECEAYLCNKAGQDAVNQGSGFFIGGSTAVRCIAHDNTNIHAAGFTFNGTGGTLVNCIADSNGTNGIQSGSTQNTTLIGCDSYNNGGSGVDLAGASAAVALIENCNFVKNGAFGITSSGSPLRNGGIINCGFGSGTQANASGDLAANLGGLNVLGSVTYAANSTPWVDPANGDFRINLATARASGRGGFTETWSGYSAPSTVGYPDIGAAQSITNSPSASGGSYTFAQ